MLLSPAARKPITPSHFLNKRTCEAIEKEELMKPLAFGFYKVDRLGTGRYNEAAQRFVDHFEGSLSVCTIRPTCI